MLKVLLVSILLSSPNNLEAASLGEVYFSESFIFNTKSSQKLNFWRSLTISLSGIKHLLGLPGEWCWQLRQQ